MTKARAVAFDFLPLRLMPQSGLFIWGRPLHTGIRTLILSAFASVRNPPLPKFVSSIPAPSAA